MTLLWMLVSIALGSGCDLRNGPLDPFEVRIPAGTEQVRLLIEVWTSDATIAWANGVLTALEERGLVGTVVVPLPAESGPSEAMLAFLAAVSEAGHEVAVRFDDSQAPRDTAANHRDIRNGLKPIHQAAGRVKTAAAPSLAKATEALLGKLGFRTILLTRGPPTSTPRPAAVFEGQPRVNVVLQAGPYAGDCGTDPRVGPWTPAAADRATQALYGASRGGAAATVRVALDGTRRAPTDARVLGRWLDEVVIPSGVQVTLPREARQAALQAFRQGTSQPDENQEQKGGRLVALAEVVTAAEGLRDVQVLPRTLPGDLTLTEAFHAFLLLMAERQEGNVVRLGQLSGPGTNATTTLTGATEVPREQIAALAKALLDDLPPEVPAALPVGGKLLTASELLLLLASAVRGDEVPTTRPVAVSEPNATGLGWGESTLP